MSALLALGLLLVAYGPPSALLIIYVARRSALLVLSLLAAFFWLGAVLLTSFVWLAAVPLQGESPHVFAAVVAVLAQEAVRLALLRSYAWGDQAALRHEVEALEAAQRSAQRRLQQGRRPLLDAGGGARERGRLSNDLAAGVSAGLGYGLMHSVMTFGAVLAAASGEAAWFRASCPGTNAFVLTAFTALFTCALHVPLTLLALDALRRWSWKRALAPLGLHMAFALAALLVETPLPGACAAALPVLVLILLLTVAAAVHVVSAPDYSARLQVASWRRTTARHAAALAEQAASASGAAQ